MKTIRMIYAGFGHMIAADRGRGWNIVFWVHSWMLLAVANMTIWHEPLEGFLWAVIAIFAYCLEVHRLALKETQAELARLKADHRI